MPGHPASTIQIETLLEYELFVRSILRGMVSDVNQVHDLSISTPCDDGAPRTFARSG